MRLIRALVLAGNAGTNARFEAAARDPEGAQRAVLGRLLVDNAGTVFGREHGFSSLSEARGYARAVPIREYEAIRPYVRRMLAGEPNVLTREAPLMFATTSGTTGEPKFVPITPRFMHEVGTVARVWIRRLVLDHPGAFDHRLLLVVSPAVEGRTGSGLPFGAMSGMAYGRVPWILRRRYAVPYEACLIKEHDARYFVTARFALGARLSGINTPNPSTLLRLASVIRERAEDLLRAIHDGTLGLPDPELKEATPDDLPRLKAGLRPDRARARALEQAARARGALLPRDAWPDLAFIACWLGGSAGVQSRMLGPLYGPAVPLRDLGLFASEGRLTIPTADGDPSGVLALGTMYFELIPEDEIDSPHPHLCLAHELELGKRYQVVLSGSHGLYRYDLNDVVEVRGFHHRAPRVAFIRKGRDMLSITGEKLHLNHVLAAVAAAERATDIRLWQFRLIPDVEKSRYDFLIEVAGARLDGSSAARLGTAFDQALVRENCEYAQKRESGRLGPPQPVAMRPGWSERVSRAEIAQGRRDFQYKWQPMKHAWDDGSRAEIDVEVDVAGEVLRSPAG